MPLHQYDYLLAIGTIFAFLDAWNIGANDVANSFATSVSSRSLTMLQAMMIASVMEFGGAIGVGARVAETIRTKIVNVKLFADDPALLMLGMVCAIVGSSTFLTIATRLGMPVSTTHSILGGVLGMGIAAVGRDGVIWWGGTINSGVTQVFIAWIVAPFCSAGFASIIFLVTKYGVMLRKDPIKMAFFMVPVYFGVTASLITMLIVWKGGASRITLTNNEIIGVIIGVGAAVGIVVGTFFVPWLYRKIKHDDWQLKWYHVFQGPLLMKRGEVPPPPQNTTIIQDYYRGHKTLDELNAERDAIMPVDRSDDPEHLGADGKGAKGLASSDTDSDHVARPAATASDYKPIVGPRPEGKWNTRPVLWWTFKRVFFHGVDQDMIQQQKKKDFLSGDLEKMHANVAHYDNKVEYMYSFLQVMTASAASFTHGANDVSNAVGPYATIFHVWSTNRSDSASPVPYWILAFGGAGIVIGLWTYGYNLMRNLGNRLTLHSPSRGFSMELGSAVTVIMATRLKLPVSTTQCICGATVGVGLCSGSWRTINWRMVSWIYLSWIITLPCTGIISGCLMGIIINAPRWGMGS